MLFSNMYIPAMEEMAFPGLIVLFILHLSSLFSLLLSSFCLLSLSIDGL